MRALDLETRRALLEFLRRDTLAVAQDLGAGDDDDRLWAAGAQLAAHVAAFDVQLSQENHLPANCRVGGLEVHGTEPQ